MKGLHQPRSTQPSSLSSQDSMDEATYETVSHEVDSRHINLSHSKCLRPKLLLTAGLKNHSSPLLDSDSFSNEESKRARRNIQLQMVQSTTTEIVVFNPLVSPSVTIPQTP